MKLTTRKDILEREAEAFPSLPTHTYEVVAQSASRHPHRKALTFFLQGDKYQKFVEWTYKALLGEITAAANMFRGLGIGDTDVVSYILPNTPETLLTVFGGETAGIVNAINPLLKAEQMVDIMQAAETKVLVTLAPFPQTDIW
ncbi:MAG: AMP-binding protein, partial [Bacteroidota bacterium]